MENDVLYNRIMNVVHKEYGDGSTAVANPTGEPTDALETIQIGDDVYSISGGSGGVITLEIAAAESGYNIGASFNDLKDAFMSGKKIITHIEFEEDGVDGDSWSDLYIIELLEGETSEGSIYFINFTCYINSVEFHFMHTVDDPTADIIVTGQNN